MLSNEVHELKREIEYVKAGYDFEVARLEGELEISQAACSDREEAHHFIKKN